MPCMICPDCHGSGSVRAALVAARAQDRTSWCPSCYGRGLVREPEEDDEHDDVPLHWPESVFWRQRAC